MAFVASDDAYSPRMEIEIVAIDNRRLKFTGDLKEFEAIISLNLEGLLAPVTKSTRALPDEPESMTRTYPAQSVSIPNKPGTTAAMIVRLELNGKSGKDLALAAMAKLMLSDGKETFTRKEILTEMKSSTGHFTRNTAKTLTQYLSTLLREGKINEFSANVFALTSSTVEEFAHRLIS